MRGYVGEMKSEREGGRGREEGKGGGGGVRCIDKILGPLFFRWGCDRGLHGLLVVLTQRPNHGVGPMRTEEGLGVREEGLGVRD